MDQKDGRGWDAWTSARLTVHHMIFTRGQRSPDVMAFCCWFLDNERVAYASRSAKDGRACLEGPSDFNSLHRASSSHIVRCGPREIRYASQWPCCAQQTHPSQVSATRFWLRNAAPFSNGSLPSRHPSDPHLALLVPSRSFPFRRIQWLGNLEKPPAHVDPAHILRLLDAWSPKRGALCYKLTAVFYRRLGMTARAVGGGEEKLVAARTCVVLMVTARWLGICSTQQAGLMRRRRGVITWRRCMYGLFPLPC